MKPEQLRALRSLTVSEVRAAHDEGYRAGYERAPSSPNPYAPEHVPVWRPLPTGEAEVRRRRAITLAQVWRVGYRRGAAQYGRDTGREWLVELMSDKRDTRRRPEPR